WLASELRARHARGGALLVVSHDRWFLDAVCTRIWEVHDGVVDGYDGGYAAYVLARAERERQAAGTAARRRNLLRKELAWLRRGPPARTSKPRFRIDAANTLIADEPAPRDTRELRQFATRRLGKDVFDLDGVTLTVPAAEGRRTLLDRLDWSIGPGDRIGLVGVNGAGKTSLLRLLTGELAPDSGTVRRGRTLAVGHLSQTVTELRGDIRVLKSVEEVRRQTTLASGREVSATSLLEDFGFRSGLLASRLDELSGGERRRLQFLRLLLAEPNVLLLDEPTNDLDIDTLTVVEDYLDTWPGTLIVVSHDRYFLERVCDVSYALLGDGRCVLLPGGVDQYLRLRREQTSDAPASTGGAVGSAGSPAAARRRSGKELAAVERRLARLGEQISRVNADLADHDPTDYVGLGTLAEQLQELQTEESDLETHWLELSELADQPAP
ncbi:MAG: ABC-F family ATP-binding cassette domain-containing protein, partial [Actinomycetes bacterium]